MEQEPNKNRNILVVVGLLVVVSVVAAILLNLKTPGKNTSNTTTLNISLTTPDTQNLSAKLNNKDFSITKTQSSTTVQPGDYTLVINKLGYKSLTAKFTAQAGRTITINADLQRESMPTITTLAAVQISGWTISDATYFDSNTWAFVIAQSGEGITADFVLQYSDAQQKWLVVLGPETIFTTDDAVKLPLDVQTYMQDNNYIVGEAQ